MKHDQAEDAPLPEETGSPEQAQEQAPAAVEELKSAILEQEVTKLRDQLLRVDGHRSSMPTGAAALQVRIWRPAE